MQYPFPAWVLGAEVLVTVLALFVLGSIRYRLDKNALTYGAGLIVAGSFLGSWWPQSLLRQDWLTHGPTALLPFIRTHLLTLHGLEDLFHADTMLFILGLTFFVACIAQTRLLESASFFILRKTDGALVPTFAILATGVSLASGVLDGVSMIGLMIRTLVIILYLGRVQGSSMIFAVLISTLITTVCGAWLAYGEPPNLIMKSNLFPHLTDAFFLKYCAPIAIGALGVVLWNTRQKLKGKRIVLDQLDLVDQFTADVSFLQARRHGEVWSAHDVVAHHAEDLRKHHGQLLQSLGKGDSLGEALVKAGVPREKRIQLLGEYVSEELAAALDDHYLAHVAGKPERVASEKKIDKALHQTQVQRLKAQKIGLLAFIPFIGLLVAHGINHKIPLFFASFGGFIVALWAVQPYKRIRQLALHEAAIEFKEYFFLLPLFFSITLLRKSGFFDSMAHGLESMITHLGPLPVAWGQFWGATILSALLDNNVVADFASNMLHHLDIGLIWLFSMAQIAGYALGGCWTHIGSAQSVVAYAFVQKEIDPHYTPLEWIKAMTGVVLQISVVSMAIISLIHLLY